MVNVIIGSARNPNYDPYKGQDNPPCGNCHHNHEIASMTAAGVKTYSTCKSVTTSRDEEGTVHTHRCSCTVRS